METLVQLKVHTEFSFREAFGRPTAIAQRLKDMGCPAAGIVDDGTWGHVPWHKALKAQGVKPLFGCERSLMLEDGRKPKFWFLAKNMSDFYAATTALHKAEITSEEQIELLLGAPGIIRFAGAALTDPGTFDFIDVNPASALSRNAALALHKKTKKPLVITSDNAYPRQEDYPAFAITIGNNRITPQWILCIDELRRAMPELTKKQFDAALKATNEVAEQCACELPEASLIHVDGNLATAVERGRKERLAAKHIKKWTNKYQARLDRELALIREKSYDSYFLVVADLVRWAKTCMLVGPARGSSAGSLVSYLLRITEVDPLVHELLFERFVDVSRFDLPDIDIDFSDQSKVWAYLAERYGKERVVRLGNVNTLQARSVISKACEELGIPDREKFDVINVLVEYSSGDSRYGHALEDTLLTTEPGHRFMEKHPAAAVMFACENSASHTGVHAAGVVVCNDPVHRYCTVDRNGVAQIDKASAEALKLLKIDALGLRTLSVIEDTGVVTAEQLYSLPLDDEKVFKVFNDRHFAGIFQFEGQAQRRVSAEVNIKSFRQIDHVTALARPGPLGGGASQKYIARAAGREPVTYRHPSMTAYLADTMGVVLYQEQVMRICFELGCFDWKTVSEIRKAMSGRKGKEYFDRRGEEFVKGALTKGLSEADAREIWAEICTFGAWGMNRSHTVSYSIISYWCAWLKAYHPLQYFAACLRNAKDEQQATELLREAVDEGIEYVAFDPEHSQVDWSVVDGRLLGGFKNVPGYGPAKSTKAIADRAAGRLDFEKLRKLPVRFKTLYPLQAQYGHIYDDPTLVGCSQGSVFSRLNQLPPSGEVLVLASVTRKELRDENETIRVARRDGRRIVGPSIFLDVFITDDSGVPVTLRFDRFIFKPLGQIASERLEEGDVLLVRGSRIPNFAMIKVKKIRCLNRPEVFNNQ